MPASKLPFRLFIALAILFLMTSKSRLGESTGYAQTVASEDQLQAAFLYNFGKFVEWPPSAFSAPNSKFNICVLGKNYFGTILDGISRSKELKKRKIEIHYLDKCCPQETCHVLFVESEWGGDMAHLLKKIQDTPVLTVSNAERFIRMGGIIRFYLEGDQLRFAINLDAAQKANLTISSELLKLARIVQRTKP